MFVYVMTVLRLLAKIALRLLVCLFVFSLLQVVVARFLPVWFTPLMFIRCGEQWAEGQKLKLSHRWVSFEDMAPSVPLAVIASEDNRFFDHGGFDFKEIKKAIGERKKGRMRGASTISQQTAKNVFLWPDPSWLRKGLEVYYTVLIELIWSKKRIMEVYLNSIEMGRGIYGIDRVAAEHFKKKPAQLTRTEAATIAATLPNPLKMNSAKPGPYVVNRRKQILRLMNNLGKITW